MVLETDFCTNLETRYLSGHAFIFILFLNLAVNIILIFRPTFRMMCLRCLWVVSRIRWLRNKFLVWLCPTWYKARL